MFVGYNIDTYTKKWLKERVEVLLGMHTLWPIQSDKTKKYYAMVPFSDMWLSIMKEMRAIGTIPMKRGHGIWSWLLKEKRGAFRRKRGKRAPVTS